MVKVDPYTVKIPKITDGDTAFEMFIDTLLSTNRTPSFFVDWNKVKEHVEENKVGISLLNSLIHSKDRYSDIKGLLMKYSKEILPVFPLIIAVRDKKMDLIEKFEVGHLEIEKYEFSRRMLNDDEIEKYAKFCEKSGILSLFGEIKDLRDYLLGVEVGMDTNARKNRGGTEMENLIQTYLKKLSKKIGIDFIPQATQKKIYEKWGKKILLDKTNRSFDFAVFHPKKHKLYLIEVNFYSGGGSKLKATAGEYKELHNFLKNQNIDFIWITDGNGWLTAKNPLEETFFNNDYILNINFVNKGILEEIIGGN